MIKDSIKIQNGVYLASPVTIDFSDAYIKVRDLEGRVYDDEVVGKLPRIFENHPQYDEWKMRQKSMHRFLNYLRGTENKSILEVGCGNGWFSAQCSKYLKNTIGIDINLLELEQAARVFNQSNLQFMYWNIFSELPFTQKFDVIVLNAVVQYFPDFNRLKERLLELLSANGELHIIDSPFYLDNEVKLAKDRTNKYYSEIGVKEMAEYYHHHSFDLIQDFEVLYKPSNSILKKIFKGKDMPFGWYKLKI
jgi:SAM-dependent methyltransferase